MEETMGIDVHKPVTAAQLDPLVRHVLPFGKYQERIQCVLRELVGVPILNDWWNNQRTPDGQHRSWLHYKMGLSCEQSAEEFRPFAEAQLVRPRPKTDHWKDVCSLYERC